ncbi:ankyrin [Penicillium sp. IBT 16267x]|nr:ankyrin [Penicillium sp. IBT 16267x]
MHYVAQYRRPVGTDPKKGLDQDEIDWKELLLYFSDEMEAADKDGRTALSFAAEAGNYVAIKMLLDPESGYDPNPDVQRFYNDIDKQRRTPLLYLLRFRHEEFSGGQRPVDKSKPGSKLIRALIRKESYDDVTLTRRKPDFFELKILNQSDDEGYTLLSRAFKLGDWLFVQVLLYISNIEVSDSIMKWQPGNVETPILIRAIEEDPDLVVWLLCLKFEDTLDCLVKGLILSDFGSFKEVVKHLPGLGWQRGQGWVLHALKHEKTSAVRDLINGGAQPDSIKLRTDWFHQYAEKWMDPSAGSSKNLYEIHSVVSDEERGEVKCNISLKFPDATLFFDAKFLERDKIRNFRSRNLLHIAWVRSKKGWVSYESILSSGRMPETDEGFISDLVSDLQYEWDLIFDTQEERFNSYTTAENTDNTRLIKYLTAERRFVDRLRQALHQHIKSIFALIEQNYEIVRLFATEPRDRFGEMQYREYSDRKISPSSLKTIIQNTEKSLQERLEKQAQDLRDTVQMELAEISVNQTIFLRRIGLITFIYLPLMFTASLFGMNVNLLQNDPDWRWYLLFGVGILLFTYGLWVVSDPNFNLDPLLACVTPQEQGRKANRAVWMHAAT